ncbi:MAG: hypothetical protein CMP65_02325 [Flavobacteriales bacterium]|nr:hypothetical protein [Flavobacteriales bacterium]
MNKYFNYFLSVNFAVVLLCFFAFAIGIATFIENDYGTTTAKALIFNSWWLELCLILLCCIFIYNIYKYKLHKIQKLPVLLLHLSFILIIIGAGLTRYIGKEGSMRIREGSLNNQFVSETVFLDFKFHDNKTEYVGQKPLLLSSLSNNKFIIPIKFNQNEISIEYVDFIHDPVDEILLNQQDGDDFIELIFPKENGGMKSEYIIKNGIRRFQDLDFSFNNQSGDIKIFKTDSVFQFVSSYDVSFMKMSDQSNGLLNANQTHIFNQKTLYTINGKNFVFKNYLTKGLLIKKSNSIKNDNSKIDLLKIKLNVNDLDTIIDLYGYKGLVSPKTYLSLNGLFISLSYGSINYSLPFAIKLKDFQLDRYPGSDSPSSFASEIEVIDKDKKFDYRIFMNNVLNYRGYRFFQSSYDNDEKGTILSVNKDRVGTFVTYSGYLSLLLSVIFVVISRFSRFNLLSKKLK